MKNNELAIYLLCNHIDYTVFYFKNPHGQEHFHNLNYY